MSIQKLPSGRYRVRVDAGRDIYGKRFRKSKNVKTLKEARTLEHYWAEQRRLKIIGTEVRLTDFIEMFYLDSTRKHVRYNTFKGYVRDIRTRIIPALGHKYISTITVANVQALVDDCPSYATAKNTRDTLRQILSLAEDMEFIHKNVAKARIRLPRNELKEPRTSSDILTTFEDIDDYIKQIKNPRYKTIAVLGLCFGLRKGEVYGLSWEDVHLDKGYIDIKKTYVKESGGYKLMPPKTEKSVRVIPIRDTARKHLEKIKKQKGPIVCTVGGKRANPDGSARRMKAYLENNNIRYISIFNMRHSFATSCINAGIEVSKVSKMLGHTQITTTFNRYVKQSTESILSVFNELEGKE